MDVASSALRSIGSATLALQQQQSPEVAANPLLNALFAKDLLLNATTP
jgi:hypothetical protein